MWWWPKDEYEEVKQRSLRLKYRPAEFGQEEIERALQAVEERHPQMLEKLPAGTPLRLFIDEETGNRWADLSHQWVHFQLEDPNSHGPLEVFLLELAPVLRGFTELRGITDDVLELSFDKALDRFKPGAASAMSLSAKGLSRLIGRRDKEPHEASHGLRVDTDSPASAAPEDTVARRPEDLLQKLVPRDEMIGPASDELLPAEQMLLLDHAHHETFGIYLRPFHRDTNATPMIVPAMVLTDLFALNHIGLADGEPDRRFVNGQSRPHLDFRLKVVSRVQTGVRDLDLILAGIVEMEEKRGPLLVQDAFFPVHWYASWERCCERLIDKGICDWHMVDGHRRAVVRDPALADRLENQIIEVISGQRVPDPQQAIIVSLWYADSWAANAATAWKRREVGMGGKDFRGPKLDMTPERWEIVDAIFSQSRWGKAIGHALDAFHTAGHFEYFHEKAALKYPIDP